jgi:hypothetical protein
MVLWDIFMLPTQGFFNALIYFYSPMKQPRISEQTGFLDDLSQHFQQWGSFQRLFKRRRSSATTVPVAVTAAAQENESQELNEDELVAQQISMNATTEGSPAVVCEEQSKVEDLASIPESISMEE